MSDTDWGKHLKVDPQMAGETKAALDARLVQYAEWIEGGDPNYIEDFFAVAFELGRRVGTAEGA